MDLMYHSTPLDTGNPGRGRNKERTKEGKAKKVQRARVPYNASFIGGIEVNMKDSAKSQQRLPYAIYKY